MDTIVQFVKTKLIDDNKLVKHFACNKLNGQKNWFSCSLVYSYQKRNNWNRKWAASAFSLKSAFRQCQAA
jgi:hypothetical protein